MPHHVPETLFASNDTHRALGSRQWAALAMLALGVGLVQISGTKPKEDNPSEDGALTGSSSSGENPMLGFAAVLLACCSSGFAGVYFEKVTRCRVG